MLTICQMESSSLDMESDDHKLGFIDCSFERERNNYLQIDLSQKPGFRKILNRQVTKSLSVTVTVAKIVISRFQQLIAELKH